MRRWKAVSTLAAITLVPSLSLFGSPAAAASGAAGECHTVADTPIYQGGNIVYSGGGVCTGGAELEDEVRVILLMKNGSAPFVEVADTERWCGYDKTSCYDTGYYPNRAGNQKWCTQVWLVNTRHSTACENQSW